MKRTYKQTANGFEEVTPIKKAGTPPSFNLQSDRSFDFDDIGDDGRMARHERKLAISDSIDRAASSGFNRREIHE